MFFTATLSFLIYACIAEQNQLDTTTTTTQLLYINNTQNESKILQNLKTEAINVEKKRQNQAEEFDEGEPQGDEEDADDDA